ncbi:MAG: MBL fold metallo-hydrolase [Candidatus Lokiarchaeota archaeon]|nr:MBL fold metallo-hydrolase [Candidatus Lokiarchaeota archaeon]
MTHINSEGKFNDSSYLIDGMLLGLPNFLAIYIVENNGMRVMFDVGTALKSRKIVKKLKEFGLYPIHKLVLTHSHWDHAQGATKLQQIQKDNEIEILASKNAVGNLKDPNKLNEYYEFESYPLEKVTPLKEGDIIDVNGLELEVINLFGHTTDSIGIINRKSRNIFVGDAIIDKLDQDAFFVPIMPPEFNENELLKSFNKLRTMENELNSISLGHFGVWTDDDYTQIIKQMESLYFDVKDSIIQWHSEGYSIDLITSNYIKKFMPNSKVWDAQVMKVLIEWMLEGLRISKAIK